MVQHSMPSSSRTAPPPALRSRTSTLAARQRSQSTTWSRRWRSARPSTSAGEVTMYQRTSMPRSTSRNSASSWASASRGVSADMVAGVSWRGSRISVVFPTYNERDSIRAAIVDFAATGVVDEIVVVNNNAAAGTSEEVAAAVGQLSNGTQVREIREYRQGYGYAIQRGLREAS